MNVKADMTFAWTYLKVLSATADIVSRELSFEARMHTLALLIDIHDICRC